MHNIKTIPDWLVQAASQGGMMQVMAEYKENNYTLEHTKRGPEGISIAVFFGAAKDGEIDIFAKLGYDSIEGKVGFIQAKDANVPSYNDLGGEALNLAEDTVFPDRNSPNYEKEMKKIPIKEKNKQELKNFIWAEALDEYHNHNQHETITFDYDGNIDSVVQKPTILAIDPSVDSKAMLSREESSNKINGTFFPVELDLKATSAIRDLEIQGPSAENVVGSAEPLFTGRETSIHLN